MILNILKKFLITIFVLISVQKFAECTCPAEYNETSDGSCYKVYDSLSLTYANAETKCSEDGAHLAYIADCNKFIYLLRYLNNTDLNQITSGLWIGANDDEEEGVWNWGNGYPVIMGVPFWGSTGTEWDPEPNGGPNENCAQLSYADQFYFHDENCEGKGSPLCEADPEFISQLGKEKENEFNLESEKLRNERSEIEGIYCQENFVYIGSFCYFFGNNLKKKTYDDSQSFCSGMNARLPILTDCVEFQQLVYEINENYDLQQDESYWIDANDRGLEDVWLWTDGNDTERGSPFWGSTNGEDEPNGGEEQNCAILYRNDRYYFHDGECNYGTSILCQASPYVNTTKK